VFNSLRQGARALAVLVPAVRAGGSALAAAILLAVIVIACVACVAICGSPERRTAALAVLDRLLRWKGVP
jgi:hypothetical protein